MRPAARCWRRWTRPNAAPAAEQEEPSGLLTITAPLRFGQLFVRPVLDEFLDVNPAVRARLVLLDRVVNLVEEGIDIAVRLAHLPDSSQVATRLGEVRRVMCASPAYVERHGAPATPAALREHNCIMEHYGAELRNLAVRVGKRKGACFPVSIQPRLIVNSAAAAADSAAAGHGVARVMSYQAAEAVRAGKLVIVLAQHEPPPIPVHLVLPSARSGAAKQRAFIAFAAPRLRQSLIEVARETEPFAAS